MRVADIECVNMDGVITIFLKAFLYISVSFFSGYAVDELQLKWNNVHTYFRSSLKILITNYFKTSYIHIIKNWKLF